MSGENNPGNSEEGGHANPPPQTPAGGEAASRGGVAADQNGTGETDAGDDKPTAFDNQLKKTDIFIAWFAGISAAAAVISAVVAIVTIREMDGAANQTERAISQLSNVVAAQQDEVNALDNGVSATRGQTNAIVAELPSLQTQASAAGRTASASETQLAATLTQTGPQLVLSFNVTPNGDGWLVTPRWDNRGTTTAVGFRGWDNSKLFVKDAPQSFDFLNPDPGTIPGTKAVVVPGIPILQQSRYLSRSDEVSMETGTMVIVWGYVEYMDSLPHPRLHRIHWCNSESVIHVGDTYEFSAPIYRPECNTRN